MKYFEIKYLIGGKEHLTKITASSRVSALKEFKEAALGIMVSIDEINEPLSAKIENFKESLEANKRTTMKKKVKLEPYIASLRQLAVMLGAGIPITQCFDEVVNTTDNKHIKYIFETIANKIEAGESVGNAFEAFTFELGNVSAAIIKLGEQTGTLHEEVNKLANILEEIHNNRKKLKAALRYPTIVMSVMIIAFVVVIQMIVPQFKEMFEEMGSELPMPTQLLLGLNEFLSQYGVFIIAGIIFSFVAHTSLYRTNKSYKYFYDKHILKVYLIGKVTKLSMMGRYIFVFNKLTNSGVPIIKALEIAANIIENDYLKEKMMVIRDAIEEGRSLNEGFVKSKQFENMTIQMIKAGEAGGALNQMLEKVDAYYSEKYSDFIDNISSYIEPIMIVILASFLTLLALGIFLPMWSMADAMDK